MKAIFIADGHLKGLDDPNQRSLVRFLGSLEGVDTLVVVGDLFDFWTGFSSVVYYRYLPVLSSLMRLREKGTSIIYLEGNHDFKMGGFFTEVLGASVYPDSCEMAADGRKVLLMHGDSIDMKRGYRIWRSFLRGPFFSGLTRVLTPAFVASVAGTLSNKSRAYGRDTAVESRQRVFARSRIAQGADAVVLAHSHVPGVYIEEAGGRRGVYANPGSWADRSYLLYSGGEFKACRFEG